MKDLSTIGERLRHFAKTNYGTVSALCRAMGKPASAFNRYISGETVPGSKVQFQLRELGCDIEWLMTGKEPAAQLPSTAPAHVPVQVQVTPSEVPTVQEQSPLPKKERDEEFEQVIEDYKMTKDALKLALRDNHEKAKIIEELLLRLSARGDGASIPPEVKKPLRV